MPISDKTAIKEIITNKLNRKTNKTERNAIFYRKKQISSLNNNSLQEKRSHTTK